MAIQHSWKYTQTVFNADVFLKATRNQFKFVLQKPFQSKKDPNVKGTVATLLILTDDMDYGKDKSGNVRDNNILNTFDVTILNGKTVLPFKKGDKVSLEGFIPEQSFVIGFDLILRFKDMKKVGE